MGKTAKGPDGKQRCAWGLAVPEFLNYHDKEWGFPVSDDTRLFEKLSLEGFQSGLSWRTILAKRQNFRKAFANFDFDRVARFTERDVSRLLKDEGIVRHRGKIEAVINNAKLAKKVVSRDGSLAAYFWSFAPVLSDRRGPRAAWMAEAASMSKKLKKDGWKFVGPTTVYAFMQAAGLINDHAQSCVVHKKVVQKQKSFRRPKAATNKSVNT